MSDDADVYARLSAPFDLKQHSKVRKGGMEQTYVPWTDYVERLNHVLGPEQWSFRILREGFTETECWVLAEVTAVVNGREVTRQQYGCEPISKGRDAKPTTDLLKSTASDALKKAVSLLGPGLYLSDQEERAEVEAAMQQAIRDGIRQAEAERKAKAANPTPRQQAPAGTPAADRVTPASPSASTPTASPAAPTSSSTTTTTAPAGAKSPNAFICAECEAVVTNEITIQKNRKGDRVTVPVSEFAPVCEARHGALYCGSHYDARQWGAEAAAA